MRVLLAGSILVRECYDDCSYAIALGECPHCSYSEAVVFGDGSEERGFKVAGRNQRISADDRAYESDGVALCCKARVGTLRAEPETLFGIDEDEAVAGLGIRIY